MPTEPLIETWIERQLPIEPNQFLLLRPFARKLTCSQADSGVPMRTQSQPPAGTGLEGQRAQVEKVLAELGVSTKPVIHVLNKVDLVAPQELAELSSDREALPVSSLQRTGLEQPLISFRIIRDPGTIRRTLNAGRIYF
jgi:hypothetical protein